MSEQLELLPLPPPAAGVPAHVRRSWLALPFRDHRRCSVCGTACITAGRRRTSQRCLDCYATRRRRARATNVPQ